MKAHGLRAVVTEADPSYMSLQKLLNARKSLPGRIKFCSDGSRRCSTFSSEHPLAQRPHAMGLVGPKSTAAGPSDLHSELLGMLWGPLRLAWYGGTPSSRVLGTKDPSYFGCYGKAATLRAPGARRRPGPQDETARVWAPRARGLLSHLAVFIIFPAYVLICTHVYIYIYVYIHTYVHVERGRNK